MRRNKPFINKITKYLPIFIILLSLSIIIGSTFAYFTDKVDKESELTFSKVELSSETTTGINGELRDVIPGTPLVNGALKFSKAIDSEALYVRVKISFSLPSEYASDSDMIMLLDALRSSTDFNINTEPTNNAVWVRDGIYYYLVEESDNNALKVVDTIDTYTLSDEIVVPRDLESLPGNAQYMKGVNFHIAFEAIQADNVSANKEETKEIFNNIFPISDNERSLTKVTFKDIDLEHNLEVVWAEDGDVLQEVEINIPVNAENEPIYVFKGWYTDSGFENKAEFGVEVKESITLYPLLYRVSEGLTYTLNSDNISYNVAQGLCEDTVVVLPLTFKELPVTEIASNGFKNNKFIKEVILNENITKINSSAFSSSSIEKIIITKGVKSIGNSGFANCTSLGVVEFEEGSKCTTLNREGFQKTAIERLEIPGSVTSISVNCFEYCDKLKNVTIEDVGQRLHMDGYAFGDCVNLETFNIVKNMDINERNPFKGCDKLILSLHEENARYSLDGDCLVKVSDGTLISGFKNAVIPDNVTKIVEYAFYKISVKSVTIPSGVTSIGFGAFRYCTNLKSVIFEEDSRCTLIDRYAFQDCENLESINYLPSGITKLPDYIFDGCKKLDNIQIPSGVTQLDNYVFNECALSEILIPSSITSIGNYVFAKCSSLSKVEFSSDSLCTTISNNTFLGCAFESITLPQGITKISNSLFSQCGNLKSFNVSNLIESIGDYAFNDCVNLENVLFTVDSVCTNIGMYAFSGCTKLQDFELPSGLLSLGSNAFSNCNSLVTMTIPDGVTVISGGLFYYCKNIVTVNISDNVTRIGSDVFRGCGKLTNFKLPSKLERIDNAPFYTVYNIKSFFVPSTLTYIYDGAFAGTRCYLLCANIEVAELVTIGWNDKIYYLVTETDFDGVDFTAVEDGGDVNGTYTDTATGNVYVRCGEVGSYTYYVKYVK